MTIGESIADPPSQYMHRYTLEYGFKRFDKSAFPSGLLSLSIFIHFACLSS
jgi:hypothetical protein